jgi:pimeloyl-ACP methyl ester carboxylesterase
MSSNHVVRVLDRLVGLGGHALDAGVRAGVRQFLPGLPSLETVPDGRMIELPGRGRTFVVDVAGPSQSAPTVVLLHSLGCTAYLSWAATLGELSRHYRVITFDQRWHGRGIRSERFAFSDCAEDVVAVMNYLDVDRALVAGYSMGGAVAQLVWRRHPHRITGLVLCSTARNFRGNHGERVFFPMMTAATHPLSSYALARVDRLAQHLPELPTVEVNNIPSWGGIEFRSTSAWSFPEVIGELGRFNSAPWIDRVNIPAAVVVTENDWAIPARRQRRLAAAIPGSEIFTAPGGHASIFLDAKNWVPVFVDAVNDVAQRVQGREAGQTAAN